ncbi:photosystem I assembly protein Ycf37 [Synechococcus sp. RS9909]|uniref:tetratricopeptide repeat protein n=1 Tax=unclassified Synechococcus TaxID=2626047 RepID=UPI0000690779|nr:MULTISPECIES: tetratricopeptide repeat protein [unclassified Synechococcus]EAQ70270.1 putative photosystem I assembly related protein [Synechococcus sp. RS9917]QNI78075.1 photosystem I assembly protein Ycf37 [Synechococcus sp. RS9909]
MDILVPQTYLLGLIGLLSIVAVLVGRQLLRVRRDELSLIRLEQEGAAGSRDAGQLYELASVQLRKRLYPQAITTLRQALKRLAGEPEEARALVENALGFALAAQKDFEGAVKHYKAALQAKPDYPVALNNLAFARERLLDLDEAAELYRQSLKLEPANATASRRLKRVEQQLRRSAARSTTSPEAADRKGF